jgi:DNA-binding NarL/FixJ family response regulator
LRQRYELQVVDELSHLLFAYEELRHAGAAAPELVVLDENLAPTGTLFVWIDRILERSAVVVMCDEASSAFHEEALSLGVSALLPRSTDARTFALTVRRALDAHAVATRVRAFGAGVPSFAAAPRASR